MGVLLVSILSSVFLVNGMALLFSSLNIVLTLMSNQIVFVTCAEYNKCRPYSEMLTYNPLTNNAV